MDYIIAALGIYGVIIFVCGVKRLCIFLFHTNTSLDDVGQKENKVSKLKEKRKKPLRKARKHNKECRWIFINRLD